MGTIDYLITTIGSSLEVAAFNALRADLSVSQPWTNLPIIKQVIDALLKYVIAYLGTKGEDGTYSLAALIVTTAQGNDVKSAMEANEIAQATGSQDDKNKAEANLINTASKLKFTDI